MSDPSDLPVVSFSSYIRAMRARMWLIIIIVVISTATAFLLADSQTRMYTASSRLMYTQPADISNPTGGDPSINVDSLVLELQSVGSAIQDPAVRARATETLGGDASTPIRVSAAVAAPRDNSNASSFADSVVITAESASPTVSAKAANAYAAAVIALRKEGEQARYQAAQKVVQNQIDMFTSPESKLSADYVNLVQQLRNLQIAEATATGDFRIVVPATAPGAPSSPKPLKSAALGLGFGLLAGIGLAFVVGRFDTRVRTHREIADILGLAVVGRIPRISRQTLQDNPLVSISAPDGQVSEALRMLRINLDWVGIDERLSSLLFTSCVKGEGKTLTLCNLAVTLARAGKRVIVVDADLRDPMVHRVFSLRNSVGLTSVALGQIELADAMQTFNPPLSALTKTRSVVPTSGPPTRGSEPAESWAQNMKVLTSGPLPPDPGEAVASRRLAATLEVLTKHEADFLLIDAPPILSVGDAGALSASVDGLLMVVSIQKAHRSTLRDGRDQLEALPCRKVGVVVVGERLEHEEYYHYKKQAPEA